jgi:tyrosine-protein kinase
MSDSTQSTLTDYLRALRRSTWLIALITLLCAAVAVAYSVLKTPTYSSTAHLTVRDPTADLPAIGGQASGGLLPLQLSSAHAPDVTRLAVLEQVKQDLNLTQSTDDIRSLVTVEVDPNSFGLNITAEDSDADDAAGIANAFAQADSRLSTADSRAKYEAAAARLTTKLNKLGASSNPQAALIAANRISILQGLATTAQPVLVSSAAQVPSSPTSPKPLRDILAAIVIGLLLGIGVAYARSVFDRRLRDSSAVEEVFEEPVLARLRSDVFGQTGAVGQNGDAAGGLDPIDGEAFRMLRENVRYLAVDRDLKTIVVTSAVPEEGKSSVAPCLAMANVASGKRTLLIECDLRRRVLADRLGIEESPGLSDYLAGNADPSEILQTVPAPVPDTANGAEPAPLVCITAGSPPPRPADVLSSSKFAEFLEEVSDAYDQIIIDCPPLLPVADTLEIVPLVDCVLVCVRLNRTTRGQVEAAKEALERLPRGPIGLVITDFKTRDSSYYRGYYHYGEQLAKAPAEN